MRIATLAGRTHVVAADGTTAYDLATASAGRFGPCPRATYDAWPQVQAWWETADLEDSGAAVAASPSEFGAPSPDPRQVFAIGLNYRDHADESGLAHPSDPPTFTKFVGSFSGPVTKLALPTPTVDWEAELVVVIGRRAERVAAGQAWAHVAGLTVGQDFSDRTLQLAGPVPQFSLGKSWPGFSPQGPWLVTPDELADPNALTIGCTVNGEVMQAGNTDQMIFPVAELIARLSAVTALFPGDVIFTGTPAGVGAGRKPARFLRPGDVVETTIDGVGTLRQTCVSA